MLEVAGAAALALTVMITIVDRHDSVLSFLSSPVRGCRPGKIVQMSEAEVRGLCIKSREIFLSQPILLELEAPLKICGQCSVHLALLCSTLNISIKSLLNLKAYKHRNESYKHNFKISF